MDRKLTADEYNGLNQIAKETKMDCWFSILEFGDKDVIWDMENNKVLSIEEGLSQFIEGVIDPLTNYRLSEDEIKAVDSLFKSVLEVENTRRTEMKVYDKLIGISDNTRKELNSIEDVAQFICKEGLTSDVRIEKGDGSLLLDTFGTFINKITDMEYREELLKVLVPMQKKLDGSDGCCNY